MPVCASVEPALPNFNGFTAGFASQARPRFGAARKYSRGSMSGLVSSGPTLPRSRRSQFANSSLRDSAGCVSPSSFGRVVSQIGFQRCRRPAQSQSSRSSS